MGGLLTQVKTDGIGFRILGPQDLPKIYTKKSEEPSILEPIETSNSTDADSAQANPSSEDPLMEFLERRKKSRLLFERRYSKRAIGLRAYMEQLNSGESSFPVTGLHLKHCR